MTVRSADFESAASACSATRALGKILDAPIIRRCSRCGKNVSMAGCHHGLFCHGIFVTRG